MIRFLLLLFVFSINFELFAQKITLVYPKNEQVVIDTSLFIIWDAVLHADNYHVQVAGDSLFQAVLIDSTTLIPNLGIDLNMNTSYFWRVRSSQSSVYTNWSDTNSFIAFSPKSLDSLILWLSADTGVTKDANGRVSQWNDLSCLNHHAYQTSVLFQPYFLDSVLGSYSAVSLESGSYYIKGLYDSISPSNYRRSLFLLFDNNYIGTLSSLFTNYVPGPTYKNIETSIYSTQLRLWLGNGSTYKLKNYPSNFAGLHIMSINIINSNAAVYNNSTFVNQLQYPYHLFNTQKYLIGGESINGSSISNPFNGQIFEIIDYAKPLDSAEIQLVNKYLLDKYTPPVNLGQNILRRYGFCDTTLTTEEMYESYLWSTGDTTRSISMGKEDTGWYWCDVPNLYGDIMRDSVFVYDLVGRSDLVDTVLCYGDTSSLQSSVFSLQFGYTFEWKNSLGQVVSTDSVLQTTLQDTYSLQITDTFGCFISDTVHIRVDSFQVQASLGIDKSLCTGDKIGLVSGQAQADSFLWSTGSGDSLIIINTAGNYSLIVSDTLGCIAKDTIVVDIHGVTPYVSFFADTVCFRDSTLFIDSSLSLDQSNLINWTWEFGDGTSLQSAVGSPQVHLLPDSGSYIAKLTVSTDSNCSNYTYKNIYIRPLPEPDFYPLTACQNHELQFQNLTIHKDSLVSFYWDFGDGNTRWQSAVGSPPILPNSIVHVYNSAGLYNVMLSARDYHGCKDSISKNVDIKPSPTADFINSEACNGTAVSFADNSTTLPYSPIQSWQWIFDSTSTSTSTSTSHLFPSAGYYPVQLTATAINQCWDTITKMVKVHAYPKANFYHDTACFNNSVNLYDQSTIQDGNINYYYWLSDGIAFSADKNATHIFNDTLEHHVVLKVRSTTLCEDSNIRIIKSHPLPNAAFSTDREYGLPPLPINFINQSSVFSLQSSALTYEWNFGDGITSITESPNHIYLDSTIYHPLLTATNTFGCWDTVSHPIYAIYAAIDVAVTDVVAEVNNGFISYSCEITNYGKQKIKKLELFAKYNSGLEITETWTGELLTGQSIQYTFKSKAQINSNQQIRYYCVRAELPLNATQEDEVVSNNTLCKDLSNEFWLSPIYPNPVSDKIQFDLVLPYSENIKIQISDINGIIIQNYEFKAVKGLNQMSIDIRQLSSGQYILHLETKDLIEVRKFIVL